MLLNLLGATNGGAPWTVTDYGMPPASADELQVYAGQMPSIKKSKETIMSQSPTKGPSMHDTPPSIKD